MSVVYWVLAGLLALAMLASGGMKLASTPAALVEKGMGWAADTSATNVKLIGLVEVLGAIGLVLPRLLDIAPVLSPLAAVGLAGVMAGAVVVHVRRKEAPTPAAVLAVVAIVTAVVGFSTL